MLDNELPYVPKMSGFAFFGTLYCTVHTVERPKYIWDLLLRISCELKISVYSNIILRNYPIFENSGNGKKYSQVFRGVDEGDWHLYSGWVGIV